MPLCRRGLGWKFRWLFPVNGRGEGATAVMALMGTGRGKWRRLSDLLFMNPWTSTDRVMLLIETKRVLKNL